MMMLKGPEKKDLSDFGLILLELTGFILMTCMMDFQMDGIYVKWSIKLIQL